MAKILTCSAFFNKLLLQHLSPVDLFSISPELDNVYRELQIVETYKNRMVSCCFSCLRSFHTDYIQYDNHYLEKESN